MAQRICVFLVATATWSPTSAAQVAEDDAKAKALVLGAKLARARVSSGELLWNVHRDSRDASRKTSIRLSVVFDVPNCRFIEQDILPSGDLDSAFRYSALIGESDLVFNDDEDGVIINTPATGHKYLLFDPRILGATTFPSPTVSLDDLLTTKWPMELVGREKIRSIDCWHIRINYFAKYPGDFWISDSDPFHIWQVSAGDKIVESNYDNPGNGKALPTRVVSRKLTEDRSDVVSIVEYESIEQRYDIRVAKSVFSMQGLGVTPGEAVVDIRKQERIGYWDGTKISAEHGQMPMPVSQSTPETRTFALMALALVTVMALLVFALFLWRRQ